MRKQGLAVNDRELAAILVRLGVGRLRNLAMAQTGNIRLGRQPFMLRPLLNRLATADRDQVTPPRAAMLIHRILTGLSRSRRPWTQIPSCH